MFKKKTENILTKRERTLIAAFIAVSIFAFIFTILTNRETLKKNNGLQSVSLQENSKNNTQKQIESEYKKRVRTIISSYEDESQKNELSYEKVLEVKKNLLDLKVPTVFKDLHLNLVMSMIKLENFFKNGLNDDRLAGEMMIRDAKVNYSWLN